MDSNHSSFTRRLAAIAAAALALGCAQVASAQTDTDNGATNPPSAQSSAPPPSPPPVTTTPPAPAPAQPAAPSTTSPAPTPVTPTAPRVTYTGLIDGYYLYQFNNPKHLSQDSLGTPLYDIRHNTPSLALAELNIAEAAPTNGGFGFKTTLIAGDTADLNHGGLGVDPNNYQEARFKNIQQLYVTWGFKGGAGIDFGKFYTPFGYEVTESNANYNYSRSDVYTYLMPFYHAGFRAYTANMHGLTLTGFITNSINDTANEGVHDDNNVKAFIGQINYTNPKGKWVGIETIGYSRDRAVFGLDPDKVTLSDTDFTYNFNANNLIGLNYAYRKDDGSFQQAVGGIVTEFVPIAQPAQDTVTVNEHIDSNGWAAYYRTQMTPKDAIALRYSSVDIHPSGEDHFRPWDATGTFEIKHSAQFLTRLEYRHDGANQEIFADKDGNFTKKQQDTLAVSEVFSF